MSFEAAEGVAKALLYEGYLLYPYRKSSVKNHKRWTFGSLYPNAHASGAAERSAVEAQVLVEGDSPRVRLRAVFLASADRALGDDRRVEAVERRVDLDFTRVSELTPEHSVLFGFPMEVWTNGGARYTTRGIAGALRVRAARLSPHLTKLSVRLENTTLPGDVATCDPELVAFGSAHLLLGCDGGAFVSLVDPPAELTGEVAACKNDGVWPALVGKGGTRDTMLASPIVVYDYPALAPESRGDYFDATEIDEMLALRVRTLSDAEKREIRAGDPRGAAVLARSEALGPNELLSLHGRRRVEEPSLGERVRLKPREGRDAFDILLRGELATVVALEEDFDGRRYCAVALEADPGRDLALSGQPGHRFFFEPDELERLP